MGRIVVRVVGAPAGVQVVALLALWVGALAGCGGPLALDEGPRGDLFRARRLWDARRPASYEYVVQRSCFCGWEWLGPVRVRVVGLTATERVYVETGASVPEQAADAFPTVDGLFDVIEDALDRHAHSIRVTYADDGVPLDISIDYMERTVDEELGLHVVEQPAPGGGTS